jgi:hypothetical protein
MSENQNHLSLFNSGFSGQEFLQHKNKNKRRSKGQGSVAFTVASSIYPTSSHPSTQSISPSSFHFTLLHTFLVAATLNTFNSILDMIWTGQHLPLDIPWFLSPSSLFFPLVFLFQPSLDFCPTISRFTIPDTFSSHTHSSNQLSFLPTHLMSCT